MKPAPIKELATIDDLAKLDIRVGTIEAVDDVEGSNKLVKLTVDFGDHTRTILAGMKQEREDLTEIIGKQALFVVNLAPRKMAGVDLGGNALRSRLRGRCEPGARRARTPRAQRHEGGLMRRSDKEITDLDTIHEIVRGLQGLSAGSGGGRRALRRTRLLRFRWRGGLLPHRQSTAGRST